MNGRRKLNKLLRQNKRRWYPPVTCTNAPALRRWRSCSHPTPAQAPSPTPPLPSTPSTHLNEGDGVLAPFLLLHQRLALLPKVVRHAVRQCTEAVLYACQYAVHAGQVLDTVIAQHVHHATVLHLRGGGKHFLLSRHFRKVKCADTVNFTKILESDYP